MTQEKKTDFLIIGQGLAGTLLAHFLKKEGKKVHLIDDGYPRAASRVAAGLINPVTGRRYVKSWKVDKLIPFARQTYRDIEKQFDISIYNEKNIIRTLFNSGEENDWQLRTADPAYTPYMLDNAELGEYATKTEPAFAYGEVKQSAQVNLPLLLDSYRKLLIEEKQLTTTVFDPEELHYYEDGVRYGEVVAKKVIFCEGHKAVDNPYFNYLPFGGAKGEVLIVKIPDANFDKIFKHRVFIAPIGEGLYWIGSSYDWEYQDDQPTAAGGAFLHERLQDVLKVPYELVEHRAAIRPTVKDRRPFLGRHPEFERLFIFNGLGTKGSSLGPYWAKHMTDYLTREVPLDPQVSIQRFVAGRIPG